VGEPINRLMGWDDRTRFYGYDIRPVQALAEKVEAVYEAVQPHGRDPMGDFDDRDLVRHAEDAGFPEIELELRVTVASRRQPAVWEQFLRTSGNPLIPAFGEAMDRALSPAERAEFTEHMKPLVEAGTGQERMVFAYLAATK
jgi:hypothetical protein